MVRILNVAEKNDAAKNIAEILSRGGYTRREGFSKFNKLYEFDYMLQGERCHMVMTSVSGHLLNQAFTGNYRKWTSCSPLELFDAPVIKICQENMDPIKKTLEKEARVARRLIIWTDCDREGENIGFEIIEVCQATNSGLQIYRAKFSEITFQSINRAIQNLGQPDNRLNDAVNVRSELDLRIGAAFTRFQTLRLQKVFPTALADTLISYGSCQFPTLGFVVERYKAIENFIPENFWKIKVTHEAENCVVDFLWKRVRLFNELACQVLFEICQESPTATVQSVKTKPKSKWRPIPLDTIELEKLGSRKLRLNAKEVMRVAEKLYTSGYISYPRTETNIFPKELNLVPLVQIQTGDPNWGEFASGILENGPTPRQGRKSDQAHPPIHPTKRANNLNGNEKTIYEFIVRHFLACLSKDAKGVETVVNIDINDEKFSASGLIILERNYLNVYPYDKWSDKEMPHYEEGQRFNPFIDKVGGETSTPQLLTEADLISLMEKHGIGTDATHAEHIETIKTRLYVGLQDNRFVPGELGMGLVEGYDAMGFEMSKPMLRSNLEKDLQRICDGTKDPAVVLSEQVSSYKQVFQEAMAQASKIDEALAKFLNENPQNLPTAGPIPDVPLHQSITKCTNCGSNIILKSKRDNKGFFLSCFGFPECRACLWFPETIQNVTVLNEICQNCSHHPKKLKFNFKPRTYFPYLEDEYISCVGGCDTLLLETLELSPFPSNRRSVGTSFSSTTSSDGGYFSENSSQRTPLGNLNNRPNSFSRGVPLPAQTQKKVLNNRSTFHSTQMPHSQNDDSHSIVCNCNQSAILLTVKKDGPNKGRRFYKCGNQGQCNFFLWADDNEGGGNSGGSSFLSSNGSTASSRRGTGFVRGRGRNDNLSSFNDSSHQSFSSYSLSDGNNFESNDTPNCNCGISSKNLTVYRDGPNKGRNFFACSKPRNEQCQFFQWSEEENLRTDPPQVSNFTNGNHEETVNCACNTTAVRLTVQKDGPNKGRQFWCCTKPRGEQCNFFLWADEAGPVPETQDRPSRGGARGRRGTRGGGVKRKNSGDASSYSRKCSCCGETGHDRRNCPSNNF